MSVSTPGTAEQIADLFRGAIRSGQLGDGERLPTIRRTARDFDVAQATAAKAYKALEHEGLVITRTAAGTRVAPGASRAPQEVIENIRALIGSSETAGLNLEDVTAILRTIWHAHTHANGAATSPHHDRIAAEIRADHAQNPATT